MRLIDADALIEFIDAGHLRHPGELTFSEVDVNMLREQPTAFDVEEVIEQLKALPRGSTWNHNSDNINRYKAIEIVKRGGRDEK